MNQIFYVPIIKYKDTMLDYFGFRRYKLNILRLDTKPI